MTGRSGSGEQTEQVIFRLRTRTSDGLRVLGIQLYTFLRLAVSYLTDLAGTASCTLAA